MNEFDNMQNRLIDKCISIIRGYWGSRACPQCLSCKLASFRMSDFPLVWVISHLFQPSRCWLFLAFVHICAGEVKEETEVLENSANDKPAAKELFYPLPYLFSYGFPGRQKHSCGREQTCRCWHLLQQELLSTPPRLLWRTFFIALVSEPVLKLAVGYVAQREHSQDPFHFWLNLAQLFFLL